MSFHIEIACFNVASVRVAQESGADRIEFCQGYDLGGITPDFESLKAIKPELHIPIFVMIRPRGGDFVYSDAEFEQMKHDLKKFREIADGFVFGMLTSDSKLDIARNSELVKLTTLPCTLHRAFDEISDSEAALEDAIACGFQNILTSGGKGNAIDNLENLTELVRKASGRITIMPGGGVRSSNIEKLSHTTALWFHSAAVTDASQDANPDEIEKIKTAN
ncbi:copper homeostasis protein CutC [Flavobacterium sp.]|uniref:copper homeostasis protein CutC n=1 Tax=Flavobacterium sp. TaxID=239 RepID=UPI001225673C|nr:copper homeostasis protein CutC [Flavobacterium sp.]RZJ71775.1 MAG: copper homeostasis protein CutC [Flavobacterium sp.]